jgi:release factor glutamine methyltransferase
MQATIQLIRKELHSLYPQHEVESLIRLIFRHLKNYSLTDIILKSDERLSPAETSAVVEIVNRLKKSEPVQYILGETDFYGLKLKVKPGVLIPRPETEELVDWIIRSEENPASILDIGTGSGCIAICLKKAFPCAVVTACDISPVALSAARENADLNHQEISFMESDILDRGTFLSKINKFDIIVSNPPYIRVSEEACMQPNVLSYEPHLALFVPDNDPLLFYNAIADFARQNLKPGGRLYLEINEAMGGGMQQLLSGSGSFKVTLRKDLQGKDRMIRAYLRTV